MEKSGDKKRLGYGYITLILSLTICLIILAYYLPKKIINENQIKSLFEKWQVENGYNFEIKRISFSPDFKTVELSARWQHAPNAIKHLDMIFKKYNNKWNIENYETSTSLIIAKREGNK